ncbi:HAMP domain-containing protein [Youhaiella tibetensis]|uniref:HAMP domain-containing protein n=2 Tax=Paradevosia tibetensis TaxID=1447062 RepID=A0A5B9DV05_9HYPH|nr:HAMP domain-containing protein [Youhaiella tibetensis]
MPMLAAAIPLAFNGTNWAFVTTMGQDEVFAPVAGMRNTMLAIGGALLAVAALGGWLFSRSISRPLTGMAGAMDELASGNLSVEIEGGKRGDELGAMARALEVFRQNAHRMVDMTEEERAASLQRRSDRAEMMQALQRAFGQVVDAAVAGDFSRRIEVQFEDAELNVLADSVNNLVATVDRGVSETGVVLAALADANLSIRMEGDYEGAFLDLKQNANRVAEKLTEVIGQLKSTSSSLKTATGEILSGANDLSERTSRQAATIEETSAAMEQLAATVLQNADRAREASQTAGTVTRTAEEGGQVMGAANNAMERIETSSSKISNIIGMIDDIAFQTNLLALNASVEAARAGEAGKGFAVVAVEVRRLAQSAAQASAEVKTLIEQSALEVKDGTRLVAEAAAKLEAMLASARSSNALMDSIAHESREQAAAIDEVNASVRQMDEMTQHNAALVEETNAAIEKTEAQARELDRVVDVFTLGRAPESGAGEAENLATLRAPPRNKSYRSEGNAALDTSWESF